MKRMDLHKMFKWRIRVTKNRLGRWYIIIGIGLLLLFISACASDRGHYRNYYHEIKCHAENEIQYCQGHSPSHLDCVCILRRDVG